MILLLCHFFLGLETKVPVKPRSSLVDQMRITADEGGAGCVCVCVETPVGERFSFQKQRTGQRASPESQKDQHLAKEAFGVDQKLSQRHVVAILCCRAGEITYCSFN